MHWDSLFSYDSMFYLTHPVSPQEAIPPHRWIWESCMRLRNNKGYIQGELNLVDTHD